MKTTTTMTPELAIYCLRRKPQSRIEASACKAALEALGAAGVSLWEIEGSVMRSLTADELAVLESARS